ncbi:MAG: P1 family peptidase, partial [Mogibacterium sp.]|nr:P1 family peptidase [Mogibacterium sp.]
MKMRKIDIGEIEGFRLGNAENAEAGTGVTVIIAEDGAVGGVDVRGGGPATRETDLLKSENTVDKIHAVVLSGGSAFGLEAGSGVMRALAEKGIGFKIDENIVVPIVPGASLYDLTIGRSDVFPDVEMGREAVRNAYEGTFESGNHGAGTGATVGKYLGYGRAMKTGIGTFACGDDYVQVGAIAAVNAVGDIYNGAGNIIAGLRTTDGKAIKGTIRVLKGLVHDESAPDLDLTDIKSIAASEALNRTASQGFSNKLSEDKAESQTEDKTGDDKDDIVAAMMRSYEQENSPQPEPSPEPAIAESTAEAAEPVLEPEPAPEPAQESV